ncbi:MAG: NERD domain-containing protein [Candidatus Azobacteroides sp.]|nr:NERD domain-containing protein [Candidatus Azobacteroides sp.]
MTVKKNGKVIVAFLLIFTVIIANKNINPSDNETEYYVTIADLNVRTGAGTHYAISFTLQKGNEVEIMSKKGSWYKIRHLDKTGYAYSKYLTHSKTISNMSELDTNYQTTQKIIPHIIKGIFTVVILFFGFIIFRKIRDKKLLKTVTKSNRGTQSERDLVLKLLKYGIPAEAIFHDLYLEKNNGSFFQTDLVVVAEVGIVVFEVKDYSGWIFGSGNQAQWTKVLAYGKQKYRFYNPIMQNNNHIGELIKRLGQFGNVPFYSIVVFYGDCVLKEINFVPNGTFLVKSNRVLEVMKMIAENNEPAQYANKDDVLRMLKEAVINGDNKEIQNQHIEDVRDMLGKHRIFE